MSSRSGRTLTAAAAQTERKEAGGFPLLLSLCTSTDPESVKES